MKMWIALLVSFFLSFGMALGMGKESSTHIFRIQAHGALGAPITLDVSGSLKEKLRTDVLVAGTGNMIGAQSQVLYIARSFTYPNSDLTKSEKQYVYAGVAGKALGDLANIIIGQTTGTRLAVTNASDDFSVAEIVIIDLLPTTLTGNMTLGEKKDFPLVTNTKYGIPVISGGKGDIAELKTHVLLPSELEQVRDDDALYVNYLMTDSQGTVIENTWDKLQPAYVDLNKVFAGLRAGLTDQRLGSRVLLAIPAAQASGKKDIYMVVDILARADKKTVTKADKTNKKS